MITAIEQRKGPIIVFTDVKDACQLGKQFNNTSINTCRHDDLRKLDVPDIAGLYPLVLISNEALLRGIDYRCKDQNITMTLFLARQVSNARLYHQALARVGRRGDQC